MMFPPCFPPGSRETPATAIRFWARKSSIAAWAVGMFGFLRGRRPIGRPRIMRRSRPEAAPDEPTAPTGSVSQCRSARASASLGPIARRRERSGHIPPGATSIDPDGRSTIVIRPPYIPIAQV